MNLVNSIVVGCLEIAFFWDRMVCSLLDWYQFARCHVYEWAVSTVTVVRTSAHLVSYYCHMWLGKSEKTHTYAYGHGLICLCPNESEETHIYAYGYRLICLCPIDSEETHTYAYGHRLICLCPNDSEKIHTYAYGHRLICLCPNDSEETHLCIWT
jgi:hypothetical protein